MAVVGYVLDETLGWRCPTEVCGAVCCRATHYIPGLPGPCDHLTAGLKCSLHGTADKPAGCQNYPRNQADIDKINEQAERAGFSERCQLTIV